jgi:hypothetical protein
MVGATNRPRAVSQIRRISVKKAGAEIWRRVLQRRAIPDGHGADAASGRRRRWGRGRGRTPVGQSRSGDLRSPITRRPRRPVSQASGQGADQVRLAGPIVPAVCPSALTVWGCMLISVVTVMYVGDKTVKCRIAPGYRQAIQNRAFRHETLSSCLVLRHRRRARVVTPPTPAPAMTAAGHRCRRSRANVRCRDRRPACAWAEGLRSRSGIPGPLSGSGCA